MIDTLDPNMTWPCPRCKVPQVVTAMFCANCAQPLGAAPAGPPVVVPLVATHPATTGSRGLWVTLGAVIFAAIVAAGGAYAYLSSGSLSPHHTITGTMDLIDTDVTYPSISSSGSSCQGTGGYSDMGPGAQVTLKDGAGAILGTTQLSAGSGSTTLCAFTFSIPNIAEVPFYSLEIARRGAITNSLATMNGNGWTFGLSLGK